MTSTLITVALSFLIPLFTFRCTAHDVRALMFDYGGRGWRLLLGLMFTLGDLIFFWMPRLSDWPVPQPKPKLVVTQVQHCARCARLYQLSDIPAEHGPLPDLSGCEHAAYVQDEPDEDNESMCHGCGQWVEPVPPPKFTSPEEADAWLELPRTWRPSRRNDPPAHPRPAHLPF